MFIYHYRVEKWFVYSCPERVILISRSSRKSTEAISYKRFGIGRKTVQKRQIRIYGNVINRKKPTLKYIIPVLRRIVDNRYQIISEYTGIGDVVLPDWEEKILVNVGFYD